MTSDLPSGDRESDAARRGRREAHGADADRTLDAVHRLEAALEAAGPGRAADWRDDVRGALRVLDDAISDEQANGAQPDSLLSDIERNQPQLRHRVHGLRTQFRMVRDTIAALRTELDDPTVDVDVRDIRERVAWLLRALRYQRARESDLIYDAFAER